MLEKALAAETNSSSEPELIQAFPDFPEIIDNSSRSAFVKCETYWFHSFVQSIRFAGAGNIHLVAGGAIARGLEVARRAYHERGAEALEAEEEGILAAIEYYGDKALPPARNGDKSPENVVRGLRSYFTEYPLAKDHIQPYRSASGRIAAEFRFSIPLEIKHPQTGQPILYAGKFDLLGYCDPLQRGDRLLWNVDEKSTTSLGDQWRNNWTLDSQFTGYCWACRHEGYDVAGTCVRGIGLLKTKITHAEVFVYRPQWMIDQWLEELYSDIERMIQSWERHHFRQGRYRKALDKFQCNGYGGCAYQTLCGSPEPDRWLNQYEVVRWNPLEDKS